MTWSLLLAFAPSRMQRSQDMFRKSTASSVSLCNHIDDAVLLRSFGLRAELARATGHLSLFPLCPPAVRLRFRALPCASLRFLGLPWASLGFLGLPWASLGFLGLPGRVTFMGRPCKIIGSATGRAATRGSRCVPCAPGSNPRFTWQQHTHEDTRTPVARCSLMHSTPETNWPPGSRPRLLAWPPCSGRPG